LKAVSAPSLDTILKDQNLRWKRGRPIPVEEYLAECPDLLNDREGAAGIAYNEFLLRKELGNAPRPEVYLRRFPHLCPELELMIELGDVLSELPPGEPGPDESTPSGDRDPCPRVPDGESPQDSEIAEGVRQILFGHQILLKIGSGGMGEVYKARELRTGRLVALKVIKAGDLASPTNVGRLHYEARTVAKLDHPNIVPIYVVGDEKRASTISA
jgi:serine/threonine-protein kinase